MTETGGGSEHADAGWDDYKERVLRNEGRLQGLEILVAETREADRKLIEQRSDSLAQELERRAESLLELVTARADAVKALGLEERAGDQREFITWVTAHERLAEQQRAAVQAQGEMALNLLRELYDTAVEQQKLATETGLEKNHEQSQAAIHELELRRVAATAQVDQMVRQWRDSDREAREIFAKETSRHLEQLNHANERINTIQSSSVTRELWQAEKDAGLAREAVLRDQIIALEKQVLTMTPLVASDRSHTQMMERIEATIEGASQVLDNKIGVVNDKVAELKTRSDSGIGRSAGYTNLYGWLIAGFGLLVSVVIVANILFGGK